MEQEQKNDESPKWVKIVQDFPAPVQQSLGNLCANCIQNLAMIACISADLYNAVNHEVEVTCAAAVATAINQD